MLFNRIIGLILILSMVIPVHAEIKNPEEGMYPPGMIKNLNLKGAGLRIPAEDIYNPEGGGLTGAVVNLSGCTGSFISPDGLIFTNHHCIFGQLQRMSTVENNLVENGFSAASPSEELPARGLICRIPESFRDVSDEVLRVAAGIEDPSERLKKIKERINEIIKSEETGDTGITVQVEEMLQGISYLMVKYKIIRDIRLVYVPPRSIGEFGRETDNWVWPRHTGDFAVLRAYTSPDGSAAYNSPENIPFKPSKYLEINPAGVTEGDFVFLLGYPGRTFRHRTSHFLEYQYNYVLPITSELYDWQIEQMEKLGKEDEGLALKFSGRIKRLANTAKNYRGKIKSLRSNNLIQRKKNEEYILQSFINADPGLKAKYGNLFSDFEKVYGVINENAPLAVWMNVINRNSELIGFARSLQELAVERNKPDSLRKSRYRQENTEKTTEELLMKLREMDLNFEKSVLLKLTEAGLGFQNTQKFNFLREILDAETAQEEKEIIGEEFKISPLLDESALRKLIQGNPEEILNLQDLFLKIAAGIMKEEEKWESAREKLNAELDILHSNLIQIKSLYSGGDIIPDANGTLRFTYGYIKGYSPADAVYYEPMSRIKGKIEKSLTGNPDYHIPENIFGLFLRSNSGEGSDGEMPVGMLYNTDTSGGNSGSPVLNARGELVGINFDRAFEATVNDFAWDGNYSRSIGADIRYIIWVIKTFGGPDYLIKELKL